MIIDAAAWHWPQWTILSLLAFQLVIYGVKHGEARDPYNIGYAVIDIGLVIIILSCGGFFS